MVLFVVVSELRAKPTSMDRGQASRVSVGSWFLSATVILFSSSNGMSQECRRCLGDEDPRSPPRLTAQEKGKAKKTTTKKRKLVDVETERAVAAAAK